MNHQALICFTIGFPSNWGKPPSTHIFSHRFFSPKARNQGFPPSEVSTSGVRLWVIYPVMKRAKVCGGGRAESGRYMPWFVHVCTDCVGYKWAWIVMGTAVNFFLGAKVLLVIALVHLLRDFGAWLDFFQSHWGEVTHSHPHVFFAGHETNIY